MARVAWQFYDPVDLTTYNWDVNPNDGGSPAVQKSIGSASPTAQDATPIFYQGVDDPQELSFSGAILSEDQYNTLVSWASLDRIILITDDLGREYRVVVKSFDPKRVRRARNPWYHTYSMTCIVMG